MATLKLYGELPQSIELSDGTSMNLVYSSFQPNYAEEPVVNFRFGYAKVNQNSLWNYYRAFVPENVFFALPDKSGNIMISETDYLKMKSKFDTYQEKQRKLQMCAELNSIGKELEEAGEIEKAIEIYELNISGDCYPARHSFDRLLVLYRKSKNYENEKRVCLKAIEVLKDAKYNERLEKINRLLK